MLLLQLLLLIWKLSFYKIQGFSKMPTTHLPAQKLLSIYHCSDTALTVGKGWAGGGCSHHCNPFLGGNAN